MAVLVGDDVTLRERAAVRAEPGAQLVEEAEVEVYEAVVRAIERADLGRRNAASGVRLRAEEDGVGRFVLGAVPRELVLPVRLDAVHVGEDPAVLALVRVSACSTGVERGRVRLIAVLDAGGARRPAEVADVAPE